MSRLRLGLDPVKADGVGGGVGVGLLVIRLGRLGPHEAHDELGTTPSRHDLLIGAPGTGVDADDTEVTTDRMSEEELLKGLEGLTPPESQPEPDTDVDVTDEDE